MRTQNSPSHIALVCFLSAAELGRLDAAAAEVGIRPQQASYHVARLEKQLGFRVFRRTWHGVTLTERGREFLPAARKVVDAYREVVPS